MVNGGDMNRIVKLTPQQAYAIYRGAKKELDLVSKSIARISNIPGFIKCKHLNIENTPYTLFKYLSLKNVKQCLNDGNILFSQPYKWDDKFEIRFYSANCDYSNILSKNDQIIATPRLFACCFTQNITSEAAWKVYSHNACQIDEKICVQLTLNVEKFRADLENYAIANDCTIYEGPMIYNYSDEEIINLHRKNAYHHNLLFKNFKLENYLCLLRIKRQAFYHENEYRFFVIPNYQKSINKDSILIPINWKNVIEDINIESRTSELVFEELCPILKAKNIIIQPKPFDLNKMKGNITIEK